MLAVTMGTMGMNGYLKVLSLKHLIRHKIVNLMKSWGSFLFFKF